MNTSLVQKWRALDHVTRAEVMRELGPDEIEALTQALRWQPLPGPQTEAYASPADILLYGGAAGGG